MGGDDKDKRGLESDLNYQTEKDLDDTDKAPVTLMLDLLAFWNNMTGLILTGG
jgi:hypothetical protein